MRICPDRRTLLNYLIHLFYTSGDFYNCDKAILWNVFGEDICNRYMKREINMSPDDLTQLAKKERKARIKAEKVREMCSNANLIRIKDLPENAIYITDTDIKYITAAIPDDQEAQRLMVALLVLYRKVNSEHKKGKKKAIKLKKGKKNEITIFQICKLADIYYNQVHSRLKLLYEKRLIDIDLQNMKVPKITVYIPDQNKEREEYKIVNINDIRLNIFENKMA